MGSTCLTAFPRGPSSSEFFNRASDLASALDSSFDPDRKRRRTSRACKVADWPAYEERAGLRTCASAMVPIPRTLATIIQRIKAPKKKTDDCACESINKLEKL